MNAAAGNLVIESPLAQSAPRGRGFEASIVVFMVLVLPLLMYFAHVAPLARVVYPASNLLIAGWLYMRRSPWYAAHVLLLFCFTSMVRRLADDQGSFDQTNPILFTPYLGCLFAFVSFVEYWLRRQPRYIGAFLLILAAAIYGGALAALNGRAIGAAVDAVKWMSGPAFAVYVIANAKSQRDLRPILENTLIIAAVAMSLYGIVQYVNPTRWDQNWMRSVQLLGMDSIGGPDPFMLRVFSTMNSPGSLGAILLAATVVTLKKPLLVAIPAIICMSIAMGLCQYRTIWAATALALVMLMFSRPGAFSPINMLAAFGVILGLSSAALVPEIRETIIKRATTMTELKADHSGEERLAQYRELSTNDSLIAGEGLGLSGAVRRLDGLQRAVIDSGLIEIWRSLGIVVGTLFLGALISLVAKLFKRAPALANNLDFDRALVVASFIQMPMGSVHTGELGFCAWMFLGLGLAALANRAPSIETVVPA